MRRGLHYQQHLLDSSRVSDLAQWAQNQRPEVLLTLSHSIRRVDTQAYDAKRKILPPRVLTHLRKVVLYTIDLCGDDIAHAFAGMPLPKYRVVTQAHDPLVNLRSILCNNPKFFLKPCSFNNHRHTAGRSVRILTDYAQALSEELEHAQQRGDSTCCQLWMTPSGPSSFGELRFVRRIHFYDPISPA